MPRTKGSKNKVKAEPTMTVEQYEEKIAQVSAEIDELSAALKAKKAELKGLTKQKLAAEAVAAAQKAEEGKQAILEAVAASGKSVEEILSLLKGE